MPGGSDATATDASQPIPADREPDAAGQPAPDPVRLVETTRRALPESFAEHWTPVMTHTHNLRSGEVGFEQAKTNLLELAERQGLDAVGVGSPWEPVSRSHYLLYEGEQRDAYYAGRVDPASVMDREAIDRFFAELNRRSERTLFYQDNETPKTRYGHLWYFGFEYLHPAWHHYDQNKPVKFYEEDPHVDINGLTGEPHWRASALEVAWRQRNHGAIPVWAHPTSWWRTGGEFTTNIASASLLHLVADGGLGGLVVMGYDAFRPSYQALWFHYLDTGALVPGFAETDWSLDSRDLAGREPVYRNLVRIDPSAARSSERLAEAVRNRPHFASSGPLVTISSDGTDMGRVVETAPDRVHSVRVEAYPAPGQGPLSRLELVGRGGRVLHALDDFEGGVARFELAGRGEPHYLVARAYGQDDAPERPQEITQFAISDPVYFHPEGFQPGPVQTDMTLTVRGDSPWLGGQLAIQRANGDVLERLDVQPGPLERTVPANARIHLSKDGREDRLFYIAVENERAQQLLRYLYEGQFLQDHPDTPPGRVPAEAFDVAAMTQALRTFRHAI
jgi:hypothetical protein